MVDKDIILEIIKGIVALASLALTLLITKKLNFVHNQINSRMDELLQSRKNEGIIEGIGKKQEIKNEKK
jgi:hypothetical protein